MHNKQWKGKRNMSQNVLVVHGGGPTAVINASLYGVIEEAKRNPEVGKVYGAIGGTGAIFSETFIDLTSFDDEKLKLLLHTPASAIGSSRYPLYEKDYEKMVDIFKKHDIKYVLLNGGNGTMDACGHIYEVCKDQDIKVVGIPKTIDNDIAMTDHSPGYGSAARFIAASTQEVGEDVKSLPIHVCIMEAMGRNAGWLTGSTALSQGEDCEGPDLIYLPELPFDLQLFGEKIRQLLQEKTSIVVAVSEGIRTADGTYVCELGNSIDFVDAFGHKQLQGTAAYLAGFLGAEIGCKTRSVEFSTLQRSASHMASRVDIEEAFMVGGAAVKAADEGYNGNMVVIDRVSDDPYMSSAGIYDVHRIANEEKLVPREWVNKEGNYVTKDFIDYVKPLIQGDYQPIMVNGLPRHLVLDMKKK